jgi:hypothetical protein
VSSQAQIAIHEGNALDSTENLSNVATNKATVAALKAANVDGKDICPRTTTTEHLSAADAIIHGAFKSGTMLVGSGGVAISSDADGAEPTGAGIFMGVSSGKPQLYLTDASGTATAVFDGSTGSVSITGTINATAGSISGSLVTGNISVATGGVTISNDGGTSGIYVGANQIYAKSGGVTTFLLDGLTGTITASRVNLTTDSSSSVNLSSGTHIFGTGIQVGTTTLGGMQSDTATALSTAQTAIQPGGGVAVDGSKYITTINVGSGIQIYTAASGARTQLTSAGMAVYNSSGHLVVQVDHTYGLWVNNLSVTPGTTERCSLAYGGAEQGYIYGGSSTLGIVANSILDISATYIYLSGILYRGSSTSYPALVVVTPSQGAGSGYASGTMAQSTGGSLWVVDGSGNWDRVRTYNYNP